MFSKIIILTLVLLATYSCVKKSSESNQVNGNASEGVSSLWPSKIIPICFEVSDAPFTKEKDFVKNIITKEYGRADFNITGWDICTETSKGIRIRIEDTNPQVLALGPALDGTPGGLILNFTFKKKSTACSESDDIRFVCIQTHALHEFGHAIGLRHEHARKDSRCEDFPGRQESSAVDIDEYDPQSIMNYCPNMEAMKSKKAQVLSQGDIATITKLYGENNPSKKDLGKGCASDGFLWDPTGCCLIRVREAPSSANYYSCLTPELCEKFSGKWVSDSSIGNGCCDGAKDSPFGRPWLPKQICTKPESIDPKADL